MLEIELWSKNSNPTLAAIKPQTHKLISVSFQYFLKLEFIFFTWFISLLVSFFNHTLPTMIGFLRAFCSTVDEKKLTQMLIPVPCSKKTSKREDHAMPFMKNSTTLLLNQNQVLKVFHLVRFIYVDQLYYWLYIY